MSGPQEKFEAGILALCTCRHTLILPQETKKEIRTTLASLKENLSLHSVKDVQAFFDRMYKEIRNSGDAALIERVTMLGTLVENGEMTGDAYMYAMIMLQLSLK